MDKRVQMWRQQGIVIEEGTVLSTLTSIRIGGPARYRALPETPEQLAYLLASCRQYNLPYLLMGKGTNLLFADEGYEGLIITVGEAFSQMEVLPGNKVRAGAGASLAALCKFTARQGFTGMENLFGIPGSVGGGVYMNAGAYGTEIGELITEVVALFPDGEIRKMSALQCNFAYRQSCFQESGFVVLECTLQLEPAEGKDVLGEMQHISDKRAERQPLDLPSAGSAFRRPVHGYASQLIEESGLKGYRVGDAQISEKHAGFVVNRGAATAADVKTLMAHVQKTVKEKTGVELEAEIIFVGRQ